VQHLPFGWSHVVLDKQGAMGEELAKFLLYSFPVADGVLSRKRGRAPAVPGWFAGDQVFPHLGHSAPDRLGQLFEDVELAELVGYLAEHHLQRFGVQGRAIGGHAVQH
jgi:hypothetical protein